MRKLLFLALLLWLVGAFMLRCRAAEPSVRARAALALASLPVPSNGLSDPFAPVNRIKTNCNCSGPEDCSCGASCTCPQCALASHRLNYSQGWQEAMRTGKPLAVFVNVNPVPMQDFIVCTATEFPGVTEPSVVLGLKTEDNNGLEQVASFYGPISEKRAKEAIESWKSRKVQRTSFLQPFALQPSFSFPTYTPPMSFGGVGRGVARGGC